MTPYLEEDPREKIIWEIALRQGKCTLKLKDKICTEYDCKNCTMRKYIDDLKEGLPEYYKFRVDDEAESYVERELEHRALNSGRRKKKSSIPSADNSAKKFAFWTITIFIVFMLFCCMI